jgi:hypothetical protein
MSKSKNSNRFYVYIYFDPRKPGKYQYDEFISDLEYFFNGQVKDNDIHLFKGEIFELSDVAEDFFLPFRIEDGKLKFVENESWRTLIMASLLLTRIHNREMR